MIFLTKAIYMKGVDSELVELNRRLRMELKQKRKYGDQSNRERNMVLAYTEPRTDRFQVYMNQLT